MRTFEMYNYPVYSEYRYVKVICNEECRNYNFDNILKIIGKYYFRRPDVGVNGICTLIRNEINKEWHLNGLRKSIQLKRVSTTQIKTIRHSFKKLNGEKLLYLPFNVVSIIFFILYLLHCIDNEEFDKKTYIQSMGNNLIKEFIYKDHSKIFEAKYDDMVYILTDETLKAKYEELIANLQAPESIMMCTYSKINWNNMDEYAIK